MPPTRRGFLQTAAGATFLPIAAEAAQTARGANNNVQIALIGAGGMGTGDVESSLSIPGVKLVAASDIYDGRLTRAKERWGADLFTTRDYREVLARRDVDAVIVATPDHWHSTITIEALKAGKDVYCEKPMVQHVEDGMPVVEAAKSSGRILQVGSQRVSSVVYQKAKDLIASGAIGQVNMIEAWWDRNSAQGAWQYSIPPDASPANIDWDRFLGRAPKVPFEPMRLFRWRNYKDYGTGVAGDLFVHLFSGMHFVMDSLGPRRVFSTGGLRFWNDGRDVPDVMLGLYDYDESGKNPPFTLALRVNFVNGGTENSGFRFVGSEGSLDLADSTVTVYRTPREAQPGMSIDTFSEAMRKESTAQYRRKYPPQTPTADSLRPQSKEQFRAPRNYSDHVDHHRNFIRAVRSRKPVVEDAAFGFRAAGPALLSNISYFEGRACEWDPKTMTRKA